MTETNAPKIVAAMWTVTSVALVFFICRILLKRWYGKKLTPDDWILGSSWCLLTIYTGLIHGATKYGLGSHYTDIPEADLPNATKYLTIGEFFAVLALQVSKTSFAVTLLRLAARTWHIWALWIIIVSLNIVMGIDAIIIFASCIPAEKIWEPTIAGKCWDPSYVVNVSIFAGVYSGFMDLLLALFPMILLRPLRIDRKEKIGVCIAMSMGVFAAIAAFVKSSYIPKLGRWKDVTYSSYIILIWAAAEAAVTIVATCIPYLRLVIVQSGHRSRGYEAHEDEHNMDRAVPSSKTDWTISSIIENRRVAVPAAVKRNTSIRNHGVIQEAQASDSWDQYTAKLSRGG